MVGGPSCPLYGRARRTDSPLLWCSVSSRHLGRYQRKHARRRSLLLAGRVSRETMNRRRTERPPCVLRAVFSAHAFLKVVLSAPRVPTGPFGRLPQFSPGSVTRCRRRVLHTSPSLEEEGGGSADRSVRDRRRSCRQSPPNARAGCPRNVKRVPARLRRAGTDTSPSRLVIKRFPPEESGSVRATPTVIRRSV